MSDDALRRAEREASGTGDPEAAARLLVARVRAGTLAGERLRQAAALGHDAARRAVGARDVAPAFARVDDVVDALGRGGLGGDRLGPPRTVDDDVVLTVRALLLAVERIGPDEPDPISLDRLERTLAWCDCPCAEHAAHAYRSRETAEFALGLRGPYVEGALRVAEAAGLAGQGKLTRDFLGVALRCVREGARDERLLAEAVRTALLRWLLA